MRRRFRSKDTKYEAGEHSAVFENPKIWNDIPYSIQNDVLSYGLLLQSPLAVVLGISMKILSSETTSVGSGPTGSLHADVDLEKGEQEARQNGENNETYSVWSEENPNELTMLPLWLDEYKYLAMRLYWSLGYLRMVWISIWKMVFWTTCMAVTSFYEMLFGITYYSAFMMHDHFPDDPYDGGAGNSSDEYDEDDEEDEGGYFQRRGQRRSAPRADDTRTTGRGRG